VPAVTSSGPPVYTSQFMTLHNFHRDVVSEITLDTHATVSDFDLKTWGFLLYPDRSGEQTLDFDILVQQILKWGILPLAQHYFQSYFTPRGPARQVYCRRFLDFAKAQLQDFANSWRLTECLIGIRVDGMRVEVLFYPVGRFPRRWEAVELSNIDVCPMYGPFEPRRNGPTAEFFETLNRIQYVWMPGSNGLYSPVDTPEPSLSDLFGTMSDSSMASVAEGVARAHTDNDSIETEAGSVHVGLDGTVTSREFKLPVSVGSSSPDCSTLCDVFLETSLLQYYYSQRSPASHFYLSSYRRCLPGVVVYVVLAFFSVLCFYF
jgi:hypothetical protein